MHKHGPVIVHCTDSKDFPISEMNLPRQSIAQRVMTKT